MHFFFRFHGIKITIWHLNRLLRQCNLQRRGNHSIINTVIKFIQDELKGSSLCFCYRYMLQKLRISGLTADKETVRLMYIFIYSRIIRIKIKIYNNMQLKYKKVKPQYKVKPLHNWTDHIRGRSQRSLTLFIHLEKSTCCICISNQTSRSYNS